MSTSKEIPAIRARGGGGGQALVALERETAVLCSALVWRYERAVGR